MTWPRRLRVTWSALRACRNPYTLGVDTATGRLFIAGITGGVLQIVDMAQ